MAELQITETKAKEIVKELKTKHGIIDVSPEDIKDFNLGLTLKGEYVHSKRELIQKFLSSIYGEISSPRTDLYQKYMATQPKRKSGEIPKFIKI